VIGEEQISLSSSAFVSDAIFFMKRNNIRRIVVRDKDDVRGVFTVDDAMYHIMEGSLDVRLVDAKMRKPVREDSGDYDKIVRKMVSENTDFVLVKNRIVTEKDLVRTFQWSRVEGEVSSISNPGIVLPPYTKVFTALETMIKRGVRHLVIGDKEAMGVLSARDVVFSYGGINLNGEISQFIQPSLISVPENFKIEEAVKIMMERNVGAMVVKGTVIKLFTLRDLIKVISKHV